MSPAAARRLLDDADLIFGEDQVLAAIKRIAAALNESLADANPLVVAVMSGAIVFAGQLLPLLDFPLEYDYLHVTRYGESTAGGELTWIAAPRTSVKGRTVVVIDDILDEGITLAAICARLRADGAKRCMTVVLADKDIGRAKPLAADIVGLVLPNRYVFGFGMDVKGAWRNLPAIYALKERSCFRS